ncbi:hypothetical protein BU23DRAFT_583707 [Bimuria novae-zelandiae CBS 107.79]|uniref:Uncharacterized protein n=1 Tax=Bimuria novae-zelandiae CBS 107.79 TaxID=1447943 RepID=A0A6A5UXS1_9PLEO|nr:hypothetical protein BU23DRAFT_583707 [Bimuria novae-zelandiae CBS 107.79]
MKDHNVTVDMVNGLTTFRSTVVKPYYQDTTIDVILAPRKRGCLPGSKNKRTVQYLIRKEEDNYALAIKLYINSVINTLGASFKYYIFKSRIVREVKGKTIHLILALVPILLTKGMSIELRNITQAYLYELIIKYFKGIIIRVIKLLYRIIEAGVY